MLKRFLNKIKRRYFPPLIAFSAKIGMRIILRTCRIEIEGLDHFVDTASKYPCILMLWHNRLTIVSEILNKFASQFIYTAFISKSRDGEPLALLATSYKAGRVLRVPHNARHRALNQMIQHLKLQKEIILITPDGPRGPRYVIKPGVIMAAREASAKIVPFSWDADRKWVLNTWDKMLIPKPFAKIKVFFGDSIALLKDDKKELDDDAHLLKTALLKLAE